MESLNNRGKFHAGRLFVSMSFLMIVLNTKSPAQTVNVTQHHNHATRDGLYIEPAFTLSAAGNLRRDLTFNGTVSGNIYAQPLYVEKGPGGRAMVIAVTES